MMSIFKKHSDLESIKPTVNQKLVCWFEIPVKNLARAMYFYAELFKVDFDCISIRDRMHAIFKSNRSDDFNISGALVDFSKEQTEFSNTKINTKIYFFCQSGLSDYITAVNLNGGKVILPKTLITNALKDGMSIIPKTLIDGKMGYFAIVEDTEGNEIGLYANS